MTDNSDPTGFVFLSYSRHDAGIVRKVQGFVWVFGLTPWRDQDSIPPGTPWRPAITRAIANCERMFVFWCRHAHNSEVVRQEYEAGLARGIPVVPIRLDGTRLPFPLSEYQEFDARRHCWWSHEVLRWERLIWLLGLVLAGLGLLMERLHALP
jgi:hypothetical protein